MVNAFPGVLETHQYPTEFASHLHRGTNKDSVGTQVKKQGWKTMELKSDPKEGLIIKLTDRDVLKEYPQVPPVLLFRTDKIIPEAAALRIEKAWREVVRVKVDPHEKKGSNDNRSGSEAYHFGFWSLYDSCMRLTKATKEQTPERLKAVDDLCGAIKEELVPIFEKLLKQYAPDSLKRQKE